jgi:hypothetical protein
MSGSVTFADESLDRSTRRKAEYDDSNPGDLVLSISKRSGGKITVPLLRNARSNVEREDYQENTLLRVKPLAEIADDLPVSVGHGAPVRQGKGVALLRTGYLYVFRGNSLWRELEINTSGHMSDVDLACVRANAGNSSTRAGSSRAVEGEWLPDILVPVFLQGQAVMHDMRMAYSEVQWSWEYILHLEQDERARKARTTGIGHAWATTVAEGLTFETGFPAAAIADVSGLRSRDLGIELMLEAPRDFVPGFDGPNNSELCVKLGKLLQRNEGEAKNSAAFDLSCEAGEDLLADARGQKGVVCVAIPDPLFRLRHSLAQLHLALHYLDAVDVSIQQNPMSHPAMLIRQAVFDPADGGTRSSLAQYADAIDRSKLDDVLDTAEKHQAISIIERHVNLLRNLMEQRHLDSILEDYRTCNDIAICEAYLLLADKINVLQQIPGVLKAQGVVSRSPILTDLKRWILDGEFLSNWAPTTETTGGDQEPGSPFKRLQTLVHDQTEVDDELLSRLHLQSLVFLEKQVNRKSESNDSGIKGVASAGKVAGMISGALNEWSSAILTVCKRLIEEEAIRQIDIQRIMQAAYSNFALVDPGLHGIRVIDRAGAVVNGAILGVSGNGLSRGLTHFDRSEGVLTRAKDYLCADLVDESGSVMASSSPSRVADVVEEAVHKVAGATTVFFAPEGHPEARKLSLLKVDFAKRAGNIVDGPAVSRGLVVLAAFNVFLESRSVLHAIRDRNGNTLLASSKLAGAFTDLTAASFKLSEVLGRPAAATGGATTKMYQMAARPLFDMKNWMVIGSRLRALEAPTLVRVTGLATFIAGGVGAGLSFWDMRISLSNKDFDAATGHAIAMTGSMIVLASPLMGSLLAIPGWGWAIFGMALAVGGGLYAGSATDDTFEKLLKRGPWGTYPDDSLPGLDGKAYYSQLIALLSPIHVTAQRYAEVEPDPALAHPDYSPKPDDYVITVQLPLVSRLKLHQQGGDNLPDSAFRLVVQEVAYLSSTSSASGLAAPVSSTRMLKTTPLTKVTARQTLPHQSAVRFLVKREIPDSDYQNLYYQESVTTQIRVGLQATLDTELGPLMFPAPVFEDYEPFDLARHNLPPAKERAVLTPYAQPKSPYWYFTEVSV